MTTLFALAVIVQPAGASIIEIGSTTEVAKPACPAKPCLALTRTTGYQAKVGTTRGLMIVPKSGRLVAWTLALGNPGPDQIKFFQDGYGGAAQAQLSILKPSKSLNYTVVAQSPLKLLQPYFGTTAQFPLVRSISVKKGYLVAITVPTWAPVLAVGLGGDTSWRASRAKGKCDDNTTQSAQLAVSLTKVQYACLYRTARLTYTATLVTYPSQTKTTGTTTTTTPTTTTTTPTTTTTTPTTTTTTPTATTP
ncbi:MAG TPA: hypothetical protein VFB41_08380 [Solirubrobacteraceae bacterium]|nr:hypothetical protein [Solirubrobacteraceae bacterium]